MSIQYQTKRTVAITAAVVGFVAVAANLAFGAYFLDKVYPGVYAAGRDVGGMTRAQARQVLSRQAAGERLSLLVQSSRSAEGETEQTYSIAPEEFGARFDADATVQAAYQRGRGPYLMALLGLQRVVQAPVVESVYAVDQAALQAFADKISSSQTEAAVDASVVVTNGAARVQPERAGWGVDRVGLMGSLRQALAAGQRTVVIKRGSTVADIRVAEATRAAQDAAQIMSRRVTLTFEDKSFTPTPAQIGEWLRFDKSNGRLVAAIDGAKLSKYIKTLSRSINVTPRNKKITVVNGEVKGEEGGADGLAVDETALAGLLSEKLLADGQAGAPALPVPTRPVAYRTEYNRVINLDTASRYIEINLSTQRLWAYQDKQVVYQSPITSGATGSGFPTAQGLFSVQAKQTNRNLNGYAIGYNYNVFVRYWMPFYGNYGMHDASWRSSFGGSDYYTNGSHGCVNLPAETAAWLFNWASVGTPVWVHS